MSKLLYFLFFPLRVWRMYQIKKECKKRLTNAIKKAKALNKRYVCRNGYEYFIGNADQMHATQKAFEKKGIRWTWNKHIEYERDID